MFEPKVKEQLGKLLQNLKRDINIIFFSQEFECGACKETKEFLNAFSELNSKIHFQVYDFVKDKITADKYSIDKIPALVLLDQNMKDSGIRFFGLPGGYEINSFIESIMEISGVKQNLPSEILSLIKSVDTPMKIEILVSLSCPHCPDAVRTANKMAIENDLITSCMIDAAVFPHLAVKYNVSSVPKTIINEKHEFIGAQPIEKLLAAIGINK